MKDDVRKHEIKVKERENMWCRNCKQEKKRNEKRKESTKAEAEITVLMLSIRAHLVCQHAVYSSLRHAGCEHSPSSPGSDVIVLSAPAPVLVREAVHLHVLVWGHCRHPTEILWVRQPGRVTSPIYNLENNLDMSNTFM